MFIFYFFCTKLMCQKKILLYCIYCNARYFTILCYKCYKKLLHILLQHLYIYIYIFIYLFYAILYKIVNAICIIISIFIFGNIKIRY